MYNGITFMLLNIGLIIVSPIPCSLEVPFNFTPPLPSNLIYIPDYIEQPVTLNDFEAQLDLDKYYSCMHEGKTYSFLNNGNRVARHGQRSTGFFTEKLEIPVNIGISPICQTMITKLLRCIDSFVKDMMQVRDDLKPQVTRGI